MFVCLFCLSVCLSVCLYLFMLVKSKLFYRRLVITNIEPQHACALSDVDIAARVTGGMAYMDMRASYDAAQTARTTYEQPYVFQQHSTGVETYGLMSEPYPTGSLYTSHPNAADAVAARTSQDCDFVMELKIPRYVVEIVFPNLDFNSSAIST